MRSEKLSSESTPEDGWRKKHAFKDIQCLVYAAVNVNEEFLRKKKVTTRAQESYKCVVEQKL